MWRSRLSLDERRAAGCVIHITLIPFGQHGDRRTEFPLALFARTRTIEIVKTSIKMVEIVMLRTMIETMNIVIETPLHIAKNLTLLTSRPTIADEYVNIDSCRHTFLAHAEGRLA